jgi:hypothetical protein
MVYGSVFLGITLDVYGLVFAVAVAVDLPPLDLQAPSHPLSSAAHAGGLATSDPDLS